MAQVRLLLALVVGSVACGSGEGPTDTASVVQIGGSWNLTETFSENRLGIICSNRAVVTIVQTGAKFRATSTQTGSCTDATGTFDNSGTFQLLDGVVEQTSVSWRDDGEPTCRYSGNLLGTPPSRMAGSVQCAGTVGGVTLDSRGTWEMTR
jgi:hypothetical protein